MVVGSSLLQSALGFPPIQANQLVDDVWMSPPIIGDVSLKTVADAVVMMGSRDTTVGELERSLEAEHESSATESSASLG